MKRLAMVGIGALALAGFASGCISEADNPAGPAGAPRLLGNEAAPGGMITFQVTIQNLAEGQPLSPPVAATHVKSMHVFEVGEPASDELEAIAENGDEGPMADKLGQSPNVTDVVRIGRPLTRRGEVFGEFTDTATFEIQAGAGDRLSLATMLICTNDGITGLDGVKLPFAEDDDTDSDSDEDTDGTLHVAAASAALDGHLARDDDDDSDGDSDDGGSTRVYYLKAYDAGTEDNTERSADIVDACGALGPVAFPEDGNENDAVDTNPRRDIRKHRGIEGDDDLDEDDHDWDGRVAKVTITRVSP